MKTSFYRGSKSSSDDNNGGNEVERFVTECQNDETDKSILVSVWKKRRVQPGISARCMHLMSVFPEGTSNGRAKEVEILKRRLDPKLTTNDVILYFRMSSMLYLVPLLGELPACSHRALRLC